MEPELTQPQPYVPTEREQKFLESVEEARYERGIISGLGPFFRRLKLLRFRADIRTSSSAKIVSA